MVFRIQPMMPAQNYKTYGFSRPLKTHWRSATCEDVDCTFYVNGWFSDIDESTADGQMQAMFIRHDKTRSFKESKVDGRTRFTYLPGTICFYHTTHRLPADMPPKFYVYGGDWRGKRGSVVYRNADNWQEDLAEHQDQLIEIIKRG